MTDDCICYVDDNGNKVRVLRCPVHGLKEDLLSKATIQTPDVKATLGPDENWPPPDNDVVADAYRQGIADAIARQMLDGAARAWCQSCEKDVEASTLAESRELLFLQEDPGIQGERYNPETKDPGRDDPANSLLICGDCKALLTGQ